MILSYLESKGLVGKRRGDEFITNCPFCGDTEYKFSVNIINGKFICNHAKRCGISGGFYELQKRFGDIPVSLKKRTESIIKTTYKKPTVQIKSQITQSVFNYLQKRKLSKQTIEHFKVCAQDNIVMFPYYKNGELVNVKYRDITDKKKMWMEKDAEPVLFNRDNIETKDIIIVEGEYDAMAFYEYGYEVVSVPNGATGNAWIDVEWDYLNTFNNIILCFDNDAAGREGALKVAKRLGIWKCLLVTLPRKDINECLIDGVSKEKIAQCIASATYIEPEHIVSPMIFAQSIKDIISRGSALNGLPTAWKDLNNIIKGWREGEVTIWTGRNGSGKSTFLNQCFLDIARRGQKCCIYSGEMQPARYLRWALFQLAEKSSITQEEVDVYLNWMSDKIYILNITGGVDYGQLLEDFEYTARRYGVKHFIIDSLMKVNIDGDEYAGQKMFVSKLCDFAKTLEVHVHLVAHPRKSFSDAEEVGKVDVKGSSHITDLADNVIVLTRVDEETKEKLLARNKRPCSMYLYVKKNREFGIEGRVSFDFNEATKTFKAVT